VIDVTRIVAEIAELARSLRGSLVHLDDRRFELLFEACQLHTDGLTRWGIEQAGSPTMER
jgi:hypothetical protein